MEERGRHDEGARRESKDEGGKMSEEVRDVE